MIKYKITIPISTIMGAMVAGTIIWVIIVAGIIIFYN